MDRDELQEINTGQTPTLATGWSEESDRDCFQMRGILELKGHHPERKGRHTDTGIELPPSLANGEAY